MKKPPPPPTAARVHELAAWYLDRYGATEATLRRWLSRRVAAALEHHPGDPEEARGWIEATIARMRELGFLDDARWAASRARALRRRGATSAAVRSALRAKGVAAGVVDEALRGEDVVDPDLAAARTYARKSRIGPWRRAPVDDDGRRRELARLARKGFSYEIARRVVDATE